jgi:acyl carrier protein
MSVRTTIAEHFQKVAFETNRTLADLSDELPLRESGLDSLGFAMVVVRLDDLLGVDPFEGNEGAFEFPLTYGDLVRLYESMTT